jgi:hypothetical protein
LFEKSILAEFSSENVHDFQNRSGLRQSGAGVILAATWQVSTFLRVAA